MTVQRPSNDSWLHQKYPKLVYFRYNPLIPQYNAFHVILGHNPNIRSVSTCFSVIRNDKDNLLSSSIKLEHFHVDMTSLWITDEPFPCGILNELYDKGVFNRLSLEVIVHENLNDDLESIRGLDTLNVVNRDFQNYKLPILSNLVELAFSFGSIPSNMESLITSLVHLERLSMFNATFDDVLLFIRWSPVLKTLKLKMYPYEEARFSDGVLNLTLLNRGRAKLQGARKVTIYAPDNVYVKTKWTMKGATNHGRNDASRFVWIDI